MPALTYVVLQTGADVSNKNSTSTVTADSIRGQLRRKEAPELIGTYKHGKLHLVLYGYKTGKAGTENKHELPPPFDNVLLFGDAYIAAYTDKSMKTSVAFNCDDYAAFYDAAFEGFDDLEDEDTEYEGSIDGEEGDEGDNNNEDDEDEDDEDEDENGDDEMAECKQATDGFIMKGVLRHGGEDCQFEEYSY